jgi:hypothetical protein
VNYAARWRTGRSASLHQSPAPVADEQWWDGLE